MNKYGIDSTNFLPFQSSEMRKMFYTLATGGGNTDDKWFQPLQGGILQPDDLVGPSTDNGEQAHDSISADQEQPMSVDQDPQVLRIQSLRSQADLINQFGHPKPHHSKGHQ